MAGAERENGVKVALLEDQQVLRDTLKIVLQFNGFEVVGATGKPNELLDLLSSHPPDVLLVDLRLSPDEELGAPASGWQVIDHVRSWQPQVRLVVVSGTRDPRDVERAQRSGVSGFLHKDLVSTDDLLEALTRVAGGERVFPLAQFTLAPAQLPREQPERLRSLTSREIEVLRFIGAGYDNLKIAASLGISERTVRAHVSNLYRKLGPENRTQLALMCREFSLGLPPVCA